MCNRVINNSSASCVSVSKLFRSGRGRKWCNRPRFLHFLRSAENPHPIVARSTCLVHGQNAESQSVRCCLAQSCCGGVIEIPDSVLQVPCLEPVRELVDPKKQTLVHEDRLHGDAEHPERSNRWNTRPRHCQLRRFRPEGACASEQT